MQYVYAIAVCFAAVVTLGTTCFADVYETRGRPFDSKNLACTAAINESNVQAANQCGAANNAYVHGCRDGYFHNCRASRREGCSCTRMGA